MPAIPNNVVANWRTWFHGQAQAAVTDVEARFAAAVTAWGLRELRPLPGGEVGWVLSCRTADGRPAVLKLTPRIPGETEELADECRALALWAASGIAPAVFGVRDDGYTFLMQRVLPGRPLHDLVTDPLETVRILGRIVGVLHREADGFCALHAGAQAADWSDVLAGTREGDELEALLIPSAQDRLLHVDFHSLNALSSDGAAGGWLAIDPKPHIGDPHADTYSLLYGVPLDFILSTPAGTRERLMDLLKAFCVTAELDIDRAAAWLRLRALSNGLWAERQELDIMASALLRVAGALDA